MKTPILLLTTALCMLGLTLYDFYLDGQRDQRAYNARMAAYMAIPRDLTDNHLTKE